MESNQVDDRPVLLRIIFAWAVVGACVAVCVMYTPGLYESSSSSEFVPYVPPGLKLHVRDKEDDPYDGKDFSTGYVKVFDKFVFRRHMPDEEAHVVVAKWHLTIMGGLAIVGSLVGGTYDWIFKARHRQARRGNWWLGLTVTALVIAFLCVMGFPGDNNWVVFLFPRPGGLDQLVIRVRPFAEVFRLTAFAVPLGWAVQTLWANRRGKTKPAADGVQA
ncbi:hypothetical protein [Zavarzinella formosa]|uniref:hypothetical protein n=1 Tax=Zavarzinella formosa TaxID=360055 RepID=UPI0002EBCE08|nr:hypothetical protein [Zavarzinella formosa]